MALIDYDNANFSGIRINDPSGASTFAQTARDSLDMIICQPVGRRLLTEISARFAAVFMAAPSCNASANMDIAGYRGEQLAAMLGNLNSIGKKRITLATTQQPAHHMKHHSFSKLHL
jgi:hypothetical protein